MVSGEMKLANDGVVGATRQSSQKDEAFSAASEIGELYPLQSFCKVFKFEYSLSGFFPPLVYGPGRKEHHAQVGTAGNGW